LVGLAIEELSTFHGHWSHCFSGSDVLTIRANPPAFLPPEIISQLLASGHQAAERSAAIGVMIS
jgi:hypothetical protein